MLWYVEGGGGVQNSFFRKEPKVIIYLEFNNGNKDRIGCFEDDLFLLYCDISIIKTKCCLKKYRVHNLKRFRPNLFIKLLSRK